MFRRTAGSLLLFACASFFIACGDAPPAGPVEGPAFNASAQPAPQETGTAGLEEYLAPHTVTRTAGPVQTTTIPLDHDRYPLFMEPFELHVQANGVGPAPAIGWVLVDGVQVLGPADLRQGSGEFVREVPVTAHSVVTVELAGLPGASVTVSMDAAFQPPPVITVDNPAPNAMLQQSTSQVTISGEACHERFPITHLEINGVEVPVSGDQLCETFSLDQTSRWGMNVIEGSVENSRGRTGSLVQAYLRSPSYFVATDHFESGARVPGAIVSRVNQSAIDDGTPDLDDVAALVNDQQRSTNIAAYMPDPLASDCWDNHGLFGNPLLAAGYRVSHGSATPVDPLLDLTAMSDGLAFSLSVPAAQLGLAASFGWDVAASCPLSDYQATVYGTVGVGSLTASGVATPVGPASQIAIGPTTVHLSHLTVYLDYGSLPDFIANAGDAITNAIASAATSQVERFAANALQGAIGDAVNTQLHQLAEVTTDPVNVGDVAVHYQTGLDGLSFHGPAGSGNAELSGYAQVVPVAPSAVHASPRGSIRGDGAAPTFVGPDWNVGIAVKDDAVNQLLWTAWHEGVFDVPDLATLLPAADLQGMNLSLASALPPVVMAGAAAGTVAIGVGSVEVDAVIDPSVAPGATGEAPIHARFSVSGVVQARPAYDEATNRIGLEDVTARVFVQIVDIDRPLDEAALAGQIGDLAAASVEALLPRAFASVPLPAVTFGSNPERTLPLYDVTVDREGHYTRLVARLGVAQ